MGKKAEGIIINFVAAGGDERMEVEIEVEKILSDRFHFEKNLSFCLLPLCCSLLLLREERRRGGEV